MLNKIDQRVCLTQSGTKRLANYMTRTYFLYFFPKYLFPSVLNTLSKFKISGLPHG